MVGIKRVSVDRKKAEKMLIEKQGCEMIVNCFSWFNGEGFRYMTMVKDMTIEKMVGDSGLIILDKDNPETDIEVMYARLKDITLIEQEKTFITYEYETVHIEIVF